MPPHLNWLRIVLIWPSVLIAAGCRDGRSGLATCVEWSIREVARCGTVDVYENRAARSGRRLSLRVVVLPARGGPAVGDPLVFLTGGPGLAATADVAYAARVFAPLRGRRDIVLVDQRGTGRSAPLNCNLYDDGPLQPYVSPMFPLDRVRACRQALESHADLTQYTTAWAADDLADVLSALGYKTANLLGVSYGSRAALVFLRRHPDRVRTMIIQGVLPPDKVATLAAGRGGTQALDAAIAACTSDPACHRTAPDPARDVDTVLARLRRSPATVTLWNWRRLRRETVTITGRGFAERLFSILYAPSRGPLMMPLIHDAVEGDWRPFARAAIDHRRWQKSGRSTGMMLSVLCAEDAPRLAAADLAGLAASSRLGLPVASELLAACAEWPRGPAVDTTSVTAAAPVLLLSGGLDPVTPPDWADSAARELPNSVRFVDSTAGHAVMTPRLVAMLANFVNSQHAVADSAAR